MKIGEINSLKVERLTDFGFFLEDKDGNEVLLPNAYITDEIKIGNLLEVFIYKDSEDRIVATTLKPLIQLGEFAYLKAKDVNKFGAFMDWGLPKDLMVPYSEQTEKMITGKGYLIILLKDEKTERLIGSNHINKYVQSDDIDLIEGEEVDLLLYNENDLGINAIINNKFKGLIFKSDIHKNIQEGDKIKGFIKQIREDGKIDLVLEPAGYSDSIDKNTKILLSAIKENDGFLNLTDKSDPEVVKKVLSLSKKAFKKALGNLYRLKKVELTKEGIKLLR